jgi:hypothetical protein
MRTVIDRVVCTIAIKDSSGGYYAIPGKQYDVILHWGNTYMDIINEQGVVSTCERVNFVSIDKYRERQLKKLGV